MLLMRHAESEFNAGLHQRPDPALTEAGTRLASLIAASRRLQYKAILCSPYRRAIQTARAMAVDGQPIKIDATIGEHVGGEVETGTPASVLQAEFPTMDFRGIPEKWWPDPVEPEDALRARAGMFAAWAEKEAQDGVWLVVSHWGFIRALTGIQMHNLGVLRIQAKEEAA